MSQHVMRAWSLAAMVALAASAGCAGKPPAEEPPRRKIVLIGWDAATWRVIDPMLRRGDLPALQGLLERGGRAVLRADPPLLSPALWTTLATGFPAAEHGVTDFELPDPAGTGHILAASFHRRRAAIWQMVSTGGQSVGFVGWWATWPAEPVRGYLVSDHLAYNRWDAWAERASKALAGRFQLTYPDELAAELESAVVRPEQVSVDELIALAPFDEAGRQELLQATAPVKFHAPSVLRFGFATDASNHAVALRLLDTREQPDLFAVVYILGDVAGHVFWHHFEPELYPELDAPDARLADAIPNVYRRLDAWTAEILERVDPESLVLLLSDHGMGAKRVLPRPGVNPAGDHTPDGILVVAGPAAPRGADLGVISQLDLAPTLLALLGLPVAEDMPGRVVASVLPREASVKWTPSYGAGDAAPASDSDSPASEAYKARLRSLGYIR